MAGLVAFESITSIKLVSKSSLASCTVRHTREQMPCCRQDMRKAWSGSLQVVSVCSTWVGNRGSGIGGLVGGATVTEMLEQHHQTLETGQAGASGAHVLSLQVLTGSEMPLKMIDSGVGSSTDGTCWRSGWRTELGIRVVLLSHSVMIVTTQLVTPFKGSLCRSRWK